ncbi:hypothetical protein TNCV_3013951 [Trichonephila clavipes]|nr:hypothetical protein TNCV_3013951 [Trichonephila clavipes]
MVRVPDSRPEGLGPMPPNTLRIHTEYVLVKSVGPKSCGLKHECRGLENISLLFSSLPKLWKNLIDMFLLRGKCVTLFGGVRGTPRNSSACKQQQGRYTNYCCNPYGKAAPITPPLSQINKTKMNNNKKKFQRGKCVTLFGGVRGTPRNSSACKQQQGRYTNYCCNPYGKAAPIIPTMVKRQ